MKNIQFLKKICFFLFIIYFSSCAHASATPTSQSEKHLEKVTLQLKWIHEFNFAGYYAAVEKGYYKDAGLEVTIKEGQPDTDFIDEVVSGRANFGVEMPELLIARNNGKPVVVLAVIFQHSPQIILARADSGIRTPHDLIGKKVMWRFDSAAELRAMLAYENVSLEEIEFMELSWDINDLIDGKVDAIHAYVTDQPFRLEKEGIESTILSPVSYGIDFYGDCLFTSEQELSEHPERVKAFREASLLGWSYAMDHPEELIDIIKEKYNATNPREYMQNEFDHINQLMLPKLVEIGHMNPGRWKHIADTFVKLKMLDPDYSLEGFLYDPTPRPDYTKIMRIVWVLLGLIALIFTSALVLFLFNRKLNKEVRERTEHLSAEILERKQAEKALKASESFLSSVIENIPHMIFIKDAKELRYIKFNKAGEELLGYSSKDLVGKNDYDFFPEKDADFFTQKDRVVLANKKLLDIPEENVQTKEKGVRTLHTKKIPILDEDGRPLFLLGISDDITESKQAGEEKMILESRLHQAQKMESVGTLAGGIAHDFNNILAAIIGYTELARGDIDKPENLIRDLDEVLKGANRAKQLVQQILTFSRKTERLLHPLRIQSIAKEVLKLLRSSIPTTIEIRQFIDPECPAVLADPTQIHQVMMNLCTNAYHAMREKVGVLDVSLKPIILNNMSASTKLDLKPGSYVKLEISDTGIGMEIDILENIFEPYYTTKDKGEGTGLGLAVVHGIVSSMQGDITVNSEPGQGTTFTVYFPAIEAIEEAYPEKLTRPLQTGSEHILFVDDDQAIARMNKTMLEKLGYKITALSSSLDAIKIFRKDPDCFDLIITDMTMPKMTGADLAREIVAVRPNIPVILCSGFSELINGDKAKVIGIREYVMKPVNQEDFAATIRKVLDAK